MYFSLIVILSSLNLVNCAKILFFIGISSHSHRVAIQPLATKLSNNGHEVTFVSPIKPEVPNPKIKEFCPQALFDINNQNDNTFSDAPVVSRVSDKYSDPFFDNFGALMWEMQSSTNEATLNSPDFRGWMENSTFDLVITEHPFREILLGVAYKNRAKVIAFSPMPMHSTEADMFGWPTEASWYPGMTLGCQYKFIPDRFCNEMNFVVWHYYYRWTYLPRINSFMKTFFQDDEMPHVQDLIKNINLYFVNTHFSNEYARSLPPFVVQVGGMHLKETTEPLPKTIADFIQSGSDGFIYISFGSFLKLSALPEAIRTSFFDAVASFSNARFLIKWDDEVPKSMPRNALPLKWFPQQDILAHPKCRGFVSQGGLMSFQQAAYFGIPVIIMPVFVDQPYIARIAVDQGIGIHLELADLNFDTFSDAIRQLLFNKELSVRAKEVSRRFKDRPMSPVATAVWWTEYVLRHNDTSHLKPLGIHQEWWQRRFLDFWITIFTAIFLINFFIFWVVLRLVRICQKSLNRPRDKFKSN